MRAVLVCIVFTLSFCVSCSHVTTLAGGGNDFPNSHTTSASLGELIADNLSSGDSWQDSVSIPTAPAPDSVAQSITIPDAPAITLGKKTASAQTTVLDFSDTSAKQLVYLYHTDTSDTMAKTDTVIYKYDDVFRDSTVKTKNMFIYKGSTLNKTTRARSTYVFRDKDGDSIINNQDGKPNKVLASVTYTLSSGIADKADVILDGGKDNNLYTKNDDRILSCTFGRFRANGDTVVFGKYSNMNPYDSVIFDPVRTDSIRVRFTLMDTDILLRRTLTEAIYNIFPLNKSGNLPAYVRAERFSVLGASLTYRIRREHTDSLFAPNDTVSVSRIARSASTVVTNDTLRMGILLGSLPSDLSTNRFVSFVRHLRKQNTNDKDVLFSCAFDTPAAYKQKPASGTFSLTIDYTDGQWLTATGSFTDAGITAQFTNSQGNTMQLTWDRSGKPE